MAKPCVGFSAATHSTTHSVNDSRGSAGSRITPGYDRSTTSPRAPGLATPPGQPAQPSPGCSAALGDLDGDAGGFDGGDREHSWLQAEFVGGFAAEQ